MSIMTYLYQQEVTLKILNMLIVSRKEIRMIITFVDDYYAGLISGNWIHIIFNLIPYFHLLSIIIPSFRMTFIINVMQ